MLALPIFQSGPCTSQGLSKIDHLNKILRLKKKAAHSGLLSQLKVIKDALLRFIFELREQRIMVSTFMVVLRALYISP